MKEYWVNVYEYKTVKNTIFLSHNMSSVEEAIERAVHRCLARPDVKCLYRIHVKIGAKSKYRSYYPMVFKDGKAVFKEPKYDDSFAKDIERMKPKQTEWVDKSDWMG